MGGAGDLGSPPGKDHRSPPPSRFFDGVVAAPPSSRCGLRRDYRETPLLGRDPAPLPLRSRVPEAEAMPSALLVARVSTVDKGQDPENQLVPLRDVAHRLGWHVMGGPPLQASAWGAKR